MRLTALVGSGLLLTSGCYDDLHKRLSEPLKKQGIKEVVIDESNIVATCAGGATVEIATTELDRNFLGMAKTSKVATIAKNILRECDDKDTAKRQADAIAANIGGEIKRLGIDATGMDDAASRKAICEKLTQALPRKDPERTIEGAQNTQRWGCGPPPPPAELPTGAWVIDMGKQPAPSFLRLQNDAGEKLTLRCVGKKPDFYVQPSAPAKKGTKVIDARVDGGKPFKWKVKPSTDGKALFFVDAKAAFKALTGATQASFAIPAKKPVTSLFTVKAFGEALKQMPKLCQ